MFVQGQEYRRRELHNRFGGQQQGGISTPTRYNLILLFTGESGQLYGYKDGWTEEGLFLYTGEGQRGDMEFVRGNLAVRDHQANGKDLHLFEYVRTGYVRYIGQMVCTGIEERRGPDVEGNDRRVIVFELTPIGSFQEAAEPLPEQAEEELWQQDLATLRQRALEAAGTANTPKERKALARHRSRAIRVYIERRANGVCEGCGQLAPFMTKAGRAYLENHHIRRLSDGGPDDPRWVVGLCPNCHARAHHGEDSAEFNQQLGETVGRTEMAYSE